MPIAAAIAGSREDGVLRGEVGAHTDGRGGVGGGVDSGIEDSVAVVTVGLEGITEEEVEEATDDAKDEIDDREASRLSIRTSEIGTCSTAVERFPPRIDEPRRVPYLVGLVNCLKRSARMEREEDSPPDKVIEVSPAESSVSE